MVLAGGRNAYLEKLDCGKIYHIGRDEQGIVWLTQSKFLGCKHSVSPRGKALDRFCTSNGYIVTNGIAKSDRTGKPTFKTQQT